MDTVQLICYTLPLRTTAQEFCDLYKLYYYNVKMAVGHPMMIPQDKINLFDDLPELYFISLVEEYISLQ